MLSPPALHRSTIFRCQTETILVWKYEIARRAILFGLVALGLVLTGGCLGYEAGLAADADTRPFSEGGGAFLFGIAFFLKVLLVLFLGSIVAKLFFLCGRGPRGRHGGHWRHGGWHRHGDDYGDYSPGDRQVNVAENTRPFLDLDGPEAPRPSSAGA
jgi:hypothetical protein